MSPSPLTSATSKMQAGLLVVDDHDLIRLGLRTLVQSQVNADDLDVPIFEARTLQEALALFEAHRSHIDLVLLDLRLPDSHGLCGLACFLDRFPGTRIVVLSGEGDPSLAQKAVSAGDIAYLHKSADLRVLLDYVRPTNAVTATTESSGGPQGKLLMRCVRTLDGTVVQLSARQSQAFDYLLSGHSNKQIAAEMYLSEGTVKNHISTLLLLFGVRSRAQLISQLR